MNIVVYGSYDYTGRLIVNELLEKGFLCHLSGRNQELLKEQAKARNLNFTVAEVGTSVYDQLIASHDIMVRAIHPYCGSDH